MKHISWLSAFSAFGNLRSRANRLIDDLSYDPHGINVVLNSDCPIPKRTYD